MESATGRPSGSSGRRRRRHRHRHRSRPGFGSAVRPYGAAIIALLIIGIGGLAAWYAAEHFLRASTSRGSSASTAVNVNSAPSVPSWEQSVSEYFEDAAQQAKAGNVTGAEVQVDQAVAEMEQVRVRSKGVPSDFFGRASAELDSILRAQPGLGSAAQNSNATGSRQEPQDAGSDFLAARLFQHVAQARVELAAMRSWQESIPGSADLAVNEAEDACRAAQ